MKLDLRDINDKSQFPEFYKERNLNTTQEKIDYLTSRMGILFSTGDFTPEEELSNLELHCLVGWDRSTTIIPDEEEKNYRLKVDQRVKHFKGNFYKILYFATHSETKEKMVVYASLEDCKVYVRPFDMFMSEVDHEKYPDVKQKYRFEALK